ncbi:MAG: hypothetical protein GQ579_05730, partial [Bacteroidales bacterium]|nr:hypothetical protein [Bacteroidales bacterium]
MDKDSPALAKFYNFHIYVPSSSVIHAWLCNVFKSRLLAYCWYNNDSNLGETYGALYTWLAAMNACPDGWHLTNDAEWGILATSLDNTSVGGKLKVEGTTHWASP